VGSDQPRVASPEPGAPAGGGDWRSLALKRAGTCVSCGTELPAGDTAWWSRSRRAVRCLAHDGDGAPTVPAVASADLEPVAAAPVPTELDVSEPVGPRSTGTAGGSALAEYERRAARREQRIRAKHPVLGGLILAVSDEPQDVRAWKTGAAGERAVGRRLDELVADGVEVMHDRRIRGSKANIDHIAVSSSGVYVIDAKNYTGMVKVDWEGGLFSPRRYRLLVGHRDCTKLVVGVEGQVQLVRAALADVAGLPAEVPVVGVLAFFDAEWPLLFPPDKINEVRLEGPRSTRDLIRRAGPLTAGQVSAVAAQLRRAFPDA
jgi:hypothetical protein